MTLCNAALGPDNQQGIFHAKLWLLQSAATLRVVVGSLNFCETPAGEALWYADLPIRKQEDRAVGACAFEQELTEFLTCCGVKPEELRFLSLFDFTVLAPEVHLVSSVPGNCLFCLVLFGFLILLCSVLFCIYC